MYDRKENSKKYLKLKLKTRRMIENKKLKLVTFLIHFSKTTLK